MALTPRLPAASVTAVKVASEIQPTGPEHKATIPPIPPITPDVIPIPPPILVVSFLYLSNVLTVVLIYSSVIAKMLSL